MCWQSRYYPSERIASCHLIVYKIVNYITPLKCRSLIKGFDYIYKKEYVGPSLEIKECKYAYGSEIYKGFHSYACLNKATKEYNTVSSKHYNVVLVECIIPKGSTFYRNEFDEIVSNRIIVNRILKTNASSPCAYNIIILFIMILLSSFLMFKFFILKLI